MWGNITGARRRPMVGTLRRRRRDALKTSVQRRYVSGEHTRRRCACERLSARESRDGGFDVTRETVDSKSAPGEVYALSVAAAPSTAAAAAPGENNRLIGKMIFEIFST